MKMKVLQLIDSLDTGGAERMAVNLANALADHVEGSYLCSTRTDGLLKNAIDPSISYYCLNKRSRFDMLALYKLYQWVRKENINILHAHSSSFFFGTLIKLMHPKLKLIWHDHYGKSEQLSKRPYKVLQFCSRWFDLVFCVNTKLVTWNTKYLNRVPIQLLSNFILPLKEKRQVTHLQGVDRKRIICLANLRPQKDHITLLRAFKEVHVIHSDWTLHLVGKDFGDSYAERIKTFIKDERLEKWVFLYGIKSDIDYILSQCEIGVLSSTSEGLPLVLMEYGRSGLAIIATDVGDCKNIVKNNNTGQLIEPSNVKAMTKALINYIEDEDVRKAAAKGLRKHVQLQFSKEVNLKIILRSYNRILS
jgi:glycosyltransferase involved in cell wall biosynthesis